ncbi:hypothetical protein [Methylobacterium gnaphalii]|nr:hypothetical protein [Methylobacterium gnaphalii]GJD69573.1 hypothetical protein MMMDOFMJ_2510 [Methylobacterium gnaphalii]
MHDLGRDDHPDHDAGDHDAGGAAEARERWKHAVVRVFPGDWLE